MENEPHTSGNQTQASPGEILKRCREFHDMSLDSAAEATKISADYLQALEENRISQFASLAYLKGFVRIYANNLGLNPDDIIRLYEKMYSGNDSNETSPRSSLSAKKKGAFRIPFQKLAIPLTLLLLIIITSTIINRTSDTPRIQQPTTAQPAPIPVNTQKPISSSRIAPPAAEKQPTSNEDKRVTESVAQQKNSAPPATQEHGGFIVSLKVLRNCSLVVTVDSSGAQQHEMTAGDRIEWQGNDQILLELPDAGAVEGTINGKPLPAFGTEGVRRNITLTKDGIK